jgi:hypothetical protein
LVGVAFPAAVFAGVGAQGEELIRSLLAADAGERASNAAKVRHQEFFRGGAVAWVDGEGGEVRVEGNVPEFNGEIGDLDVYEDAPSEAADGDHGGVFAGF